MAGFSIFLFLSLTLPQLVSALGRFITPSGADGENKYIIGSTVDLRWTDISDYDILSLGIFQSTNRTRTWLISNKKTHPRTYSWTVDVSMFDNSSSLFQLIIAKGTEFGAPFTSPLFEVTEAQTLPTTSSTSTAEGTTSTGAVDTSTPKSPNQSSTGLSTGAKAGIGVGVAVAFIAGAAIAWWFARSRKKRQPNGTSSMLESSITPDTEKDSSITTQNPLSQPATYEIGSGERRPAELDASGGDRIRGRPQM